MPLGFALFLVFLILKLTSFIDWSWWWITAPVWIPLGLAGLFSALGSSIAFFGYRRLKK